MVTFVTVRIESHDGTIAELKTTPIQIEVYKGHSLLLGSKAKPPPFISLPLEGHAISDGDGKVKRDRRRFKLVGKEITLPNNVKWLRYEEVCS